MKASETIQAKQNMSAADAGNAVLQRQCAHCEEEEKTPRLSANLMAEPVTSGATGPVIQRSVSESPVVRDFQPGAQVCMVHLHGDEQNAFHTAQNLHGRFCSNFVHLTYGTPPDRFIHVTAGTNAASCLADPNRIFNDRGITSTLRANNSAGTCRSAATARELSNFRDNELMPAINACRAGANDTRLPVVAFHNNTQGALSINSYAARGSERGAAETSRSRLGRRTNPSVASGADPDNFLLVTDIRDFNAFSGSRNVVLQSSSPTDDGSLSVEMASDRYINVESQEDVFVSTTDPFFVANLAAGQDVMRQLGVNACPAAVRTSPTAIRQKSEPDQQPAEELTLGERLLLLLQRIIDYLRRLLGLSESSLRDPIPAQLSGRCLTFNSLQELENRKAHWAGVITGMTIPDVVKWIVGIDPPVPSALQESIQQKNCLLDALQIAASNPSGGIQLPTLPAGRNAHTDWTESGYRNFQNQRRIWHRKFNFTGAPFDRISAAAVAACPSSGLVEGQQWNPGNSSHVTCWNSLTAEQRQQEILQASSAPGISRHHWGSDFDLFSVEPSEWALTGTGQRFEDEFTWLRRNAASYGFIQSFTASSVPSGSQGYMEERWHWSYFPVSQALLEFAQSNRARIQAELTSQWGVSSQFSFINSHWQDFMFNVSSRARF
jgi:hypothetical protein